MSRVAFGWDNYTGPFGPRTVETLRSLSQRSEGGAHPPPDSGGWK